MTPMTSRGKASAPIPLTIAAGRTVEAIGERVGDGARAERDRRNDDVRSAHRAYLVMPSALSSLSPSA